MAATTAHDAEQANDRRYMAAAIRLARKHAGLTSTNDDDMRQLPSPSLV